MKVKRHAGMGLASCRRRSKRKYIRRTSGIMKVKRRIGMGGHASRRGPKGRKAIPRKSSRSQKKVHFGSGIVNKVCKHMKRFSNCKPAKRVLSKATSAALLAARKHIRSIGGKRLIQLPRVIPIPKGGGILPLIPIFAGLSALGGLAGGIANITRAAKTASSVREQIQNKSTSPPSSNVNRIGDGLFLKPYRSSG
ncbi:unnamed protein product [Acanthoscelides obtectus]|uniref:Uncharacterized protein n=1 Tax=Acanthoscelides obtectus TaxID=200917 RepID=A0A9P0LTY4_ACAOB|nr:unnamed protein product [Acanthoscelides obtectus]CAK1641237.1 hypothetical protein AOBTE_LOCUS12257 [Acanthoscelides obtectus]